MQSLRYYEIVLGQWWKKFQKTSFVYIILFFALFYFAKCNWVSAKLNTIAEIILNKISTLDLSRSYTGADLMESYLYLFILPFLLSLFLVNRILICILNFFILTIVFYKIYESYLNIENAIPAIIKDKIMPYFVVNYHTEMYVFFILVFLWLISGILNLFLFKKSKIS
jgi:hypothetical protein